MALRPTIALPAIVASAIAPGPDCKQPAGATSVGIGSSVVSCTPFCGSNFMCPGIYPGLGRGGETGFQVHKPIALLEGDRTIAILQSAYNGPARGENRALAGNI